MTAGMLVVALLIAGVAFAQDRRGRGKGPGEYLRAQAYANTAPAAQATVTRLLVNPFGEVDGLLLDTGVIVTFPPHMGDALAAAVTVGDTVVVKGNPVMPGQINGYVVTNARTNQTLMVLPKPTAGVRLPPHLRGVGLKEMSAQGEIRHLRHGAKGELTGVILADGTIVRLSRDAAYRFGTLFRVGQSIVATGYGTESPHGRALEATALSAQGQR
jgi:hypothetical protein